MQKNGLIAILFLILCSVVVSASMYCRDNACSNQFFDLNGIQSNNPVWTFRGSGYLAYSEPNSIIKCSLDYSLFNPISFDYNNDSFTDTALVTSINTIDIYDSQCILIDHIIVNDTIAAPIALTDYNYDQKFDLTVLGENSLRIYNSSGDIVKYYDIVKDKCLNSSLLPTYFTCTDHICWIGSAGVTKFSTYSVGLTGFTLYGNCSKPQTEFGTSIGSENLFINSQYFDDTLKAYTSICGITTTPVYMCLILNETGNYSYATSSSSIASGFDFTTGYSISAMQGGFVKLGNQFRFVLSATEGNTVINLSGIAVYDRNFNMIFNSSKICNGKSVCSSAANLWETSNFVVSDFNKDGYNELCYLRAENSTISNDTLYLQCVNGNGVNQYTFSFSRTALGWDSLPASFSLIDYNSSRGFQHVVLPSGIYYITPTLKEVVYDAGLENSNTYGDYLINYFDTDIFDFVTSKWIGNPITVYGYQSNSYMLSHSIVTTCGNDICEFGENFINCPADCLGPAGNITTSCDCTSTAGLCPAPYDTCNNNKCVFGLNTSYPCVSDTDCSFSQPICYFGHCVNSVCGGWINPSTGNQGSGSKVEQTEIGNLLDQVFGMSSFAKLVFAIIFTLGFGLIAIIMIAMISSIFKVVIPATVYIITSLGSMLMALSVICIIFNFIWFLVLIILGSAAIALLYFMLKPGST